MKTDPPAAAILCVEDEPEVRAAVVRDLAVFESRFRIEAAEDVGEAEEILRELDAAGVTLAAIVCDHRLPGETGVSFLGRLQADPARRAAGKILLTGQADHQDTIRAINEGGLDHYLAKPWRAEELHEVLRRLLTDFVIENDGPPLPYVAVLDGARLLEHIARRGLAE